MDTRIQALEKAKERIIEFVESGDAVRMVEMTKSFTVVAVDDDGTAIECIFDFAEPKPLERDAEVFDKKNGVYRYAAGELDRDLCNIFYPLGYCSKNIKDGLTGWANLSGFDFEIIEIPGELERVQTPDHECINSGCVKYVNKWQRVESDKFLNGDCERCTVLVGTPSGLKST